MSGPAFEHSPPREPRPDDPAHNRPIEDPPEPGSDEPVEEPEDPRDPAPDGGGGGLYAVDQLD
jgi:hypothetical protein